MNVLVNGIGNIGTTILNLLVEYKQVLGIDDIFALKNSPNPWNEEELRILTQKGVRICTRKDDQFESYDSIIYQIDYIFDCTGNGGGMNNLVTYKSLKRLKGASSQGSEKNFGTSYMSGINDKTILGAPFVHVVSCNTHAIASIVSTITDEYYEDLEFVDFVIVRRSEDIGNHERLVSANVIARHLDPVLGTHHSIDVLDLYKTKGIEFKVTSSDITTPSQMMHGVRFNIQFNCEIEWKEIEKRIARNPFIASTVKFDSNVIFELGRRYSFNGRILSHAILISNNFLITKKSIKGWAFIPQEGNTILSTINAFLLQTNHPNVKEVMLQLKHDLLRKTW